MPICRVRHPASVGPAPVGRLAATPRTRARAVARVAAARDDGPFGVRMVGTESPAVTRLVRDLGPSGLVTVTGHVSASEIVPIQRSAAVLLAFGTRTRYKISSKDHLRER